MAFSKDAANGKSAGRAARATRPAAAAAMRRLAVRRLVVVVAADAKSAADRLLLVADGFEHREADDDGKMGAASCDANNLETISRVQSVNAALAPLQ